MRSKGPVTEMERDYVRSKFPQMSVAEIANSMGRSRACVNNIVKKEGLREGRTRSPSTGNAPAAPADGTLGRLKELREMLRSSLAVAQPREIAGIAREYRATVEAIERMEGGSDDEAASALDAVAKSIALRMSS